MQTPKPWLWRTHMHKQIQTRYLLHTDILSHILWHSEQAVSVHSHVQNLQTYTFPAYTYWLETCSSTHNLTLNHGWHLLTYTLPLLCIDFIYTYIQRKAITYKNTPALTHTYAERAVLRCSIRLSMALILISKNGKSLLGVVGAGGERYISLLHTPTQRDILVLLMDCLWKTHFSWIMLLFISYVWYHSELCRYNWLWGILVESRV